MRYTNNQDFRFALIWSERLIPFAPVSGAVWYGTGTGWTGNSPAAACSPSCFRPGRSCSAATGAPPWWRCRPRNTETGKMPARPCGPSWTPRLRSARFWRVRPLKSDPARADRLSAGDVRKVHRALESAHGDGLNYFRDLAKAMAAMTPMATRPRTPGAGNRPITISPARAGPALIVAAPTARTAAVMVFRNMLCTPLFCPNIFFRNCFKTGLNPWFGPGPDDRREILPTLTRTVQPNLCHMPRKSHTNLLTH